MRGIVAGLVAGMGLGCGGSAPSPPPPDDQVLTSAHFRYHARAGVPVDPTIMDRLERHRAEFNERLGVKNDMVDYHLFPDLDDLLRNSTCHDSDCTDGTTVYTTDPFQEHELIHAYMRPTGVPSSLAIEGIAQWHACLKPHVAMAVDPGAWPLFASSQPHEDGPGPEGVYTFGQRLVAWMLDVGDAARFVTYYGQTPWTLDPTAFASTFELYWGQPIGDVALRISSDRRYARSSCSCLAPSLPSDETAVSVVAGQEYRVLDVAEETRFEATGETGVPLVPASCAGAEPLYLLEAGRPWVTVGRLTPGRYALRAATSWQGTVTASQRRQPFGDPSCEAAAAAPLDVGSRNAILWVSSERADAVTWFAVVTNGNQMAIGHAGSTLSVCAACQGGSCRTVSSNDSGGGEIARLPAGLSLIGVVSQMPGWDAGATLYWQP